MSDSSSTDTSLTNTDNTAYVVTTIALLGGILAFFYFYIYDPKSDEEEEAQNDNISVLEPRDFTIDELKYYDGTDGKPLCISVNHVVYDVTPGKQFYGPGGPYAMLAGREGSRALAKMSLEKSDVKDEWDDLSDLSPSEEDTLNDWVMKFQTRYNKIGKLVKSHDPDE